MTVTDDDVLWAYEAAREKIRCDPIPALRVPSSVDVAAELMHLTRERVRLAEVLATCKRLGKRLADMD